jgi:hypothetical protein
MNESAKRAFMKNGWKAQEARKRSRLRVPSSAAKCFGPYQKEEIKKKKNSDRKNERKGLTLIGLLMEGLPG